MKKDSESIGLEEVLESESVEDVEEADDVRDEVEGIREVDMFMVTKARVVKFKRGASEEGRGKWVWWPKVSSTTGEFKGGDLPLLGILAGTTNLAAPLSDPPRRQTRMQPTEPSN